MNLFDTTVGIWNSFFLSDPRLKGNTNGRLSANVGIPGQWTLRTTSALPYPLPPSFSPLTFNFIVFYLHGLPGQCGAAVISNLIPNPPHITMLVLLKATEDIQRASGYTLLIATATDDQECFKKALLECKWDIVREFTNARTRNHVTVYMKTVDHKGPWWYEGLKTEENPAKEGTQPTPPPDGDPGRPPQPVA